jgi:hypothetical protein
VITTLEVLTGQSIEGITSSAAVRYRELELAECRW